MNSSHGFYSCFERTYFLRKFRPWPRKHTICYSSTIELRTKAINWSANHGAGYGAKFKVQILKKKKNGQTNVVCQRNAYLPFNLHEIIYQRRNKTSDIASLIANAIAKAITRNDIFVCKMNSILYVYVVEFYASVCFFMKYLQIPAKSMNSTCGLCYLAMREFKKHKHRKTINKNSDNEK